MPTHPRPADLFRHGLRLLLEKNIPAWVDLWDDDGVFEFPFAPEGWPERLEGKAAVADYMRHYPDHIDLHAFPAYTSTRPASRTPSSSRCAEWDGW